MNKMSTGETDSISSELRRRKSNSGWRTQLPNLLRGGIHDLWNSPPGSIPALDILRSIAILLVFGGHFADSFGASGELLKLPFFYWSWTGVDLFFVLSGILIGGQLWKELKSTGTIHISKFLLRRGFRIWPLYFALLTMLSVEAVLHLRSAGGLTADLFFVSNYFHHQIGGGWSLSTEEQFYILAPVLLVVFSRSPLRRHVWIGPVLLLIASAASRAFSLSMTHENLADLRQRLYFQLHTHCDGLLLGLLISWVQVFAFNRVRTIRVRGAVCIAMILMGIVLYAVSPVVFNFTSLALIFGAAAFLGMTPGLMTRVPDWRIFHLISRLSYGIYLNHFGLLPRLASLYARKGGSTGGPIFWLSAAGSFVACAIFAAVTYQFIEWPFLRLRSRWLKSLSFGDKLAVDVTRP